MTGPIDESRHAIIRVSEDGTQTYTPKPWRELTNEDRQRISDLQALERWQERLYARRARRPPRQKPEQKEVSDDADE